MTNARADLVVVGAGPGGYVAAIRAAQLGLKVTVVEREHLGGICLNWGCIPTKALLRTAEVFHLIAHAKDFGLEVEAPRFAMDKVVERSRKVAAQLTAGVKGLLKKHKVTVVDGVARLTGRNTVTVALKGGGEAVIEAGHVVLATGARARDLPALAALGDRLWTYREAMVPRAMPKRLVIVGSGAIGIEFASFYRTLGAEVTVVELLDRILPVEDEEISGLARKSFERQGMKIMTGAEVTAARRAGEGVAVTVAAKGAAPMEIEADRVISAVGIVGNTENLGLEALGIRVERTHVAVDAHGETSVSGVYAIGDLAGPPWLAHKASHEGVHVAERIAGVEGIHPVETTNIPGCTYSMPQIASVGLTEAAAKAAGRNVKVGRFPFIGNGKAIALGETNGLVKTIFDARSGELLGAHMIGAEVTELIQGYTIAKNLETTEAELMHTVFPHPTLSEMMHESVLDAYGRVLHL